MPTRHTVPVADGESVVAVHHEAEAATGPPLVFCHGFLSDKSGSYEGRCRRATAEGRDAVRFDFRGCGESDGAFVDQTLSDKVADLRAVVDHFGFDAVTLFGSSFGGKVVFHAVDPLAADGVRVTAVATRAPVTYNRTFDEARTTVEREGSLTFETGQTVDGRFFDDLDEHPFDGVAGTLDCPVLVVHGADDGSVAVADSFEAAATLETDVLLEKVAGEGHRFAEASEDRLRTRLFDWLASLGGG